MDLRAIRKRTHKTMNDVAEEIGVSVQTISRWETRASIPPMNRINLIAKVYGIDVNILRQDIIKELQDKGGGYTDDEYIVKTLNQLEHDSSEIKEKIIIHSFSTRGFLTGNRPNVALSVCKCAAAGIEVVYFCLPPSLREENIERVNPNRARIILQSQIKDSIKYWQSIGQTADESKIFKHLWTVTANDKADIDIMGHIYGNLIKPLIIIHERGNLHSQQVVDDPWLEIIPLHFIVTDIWIHMNENTNGDPDVPRWLRITATQNHQREYYNAISTIRGSQQYELLPLIEK